MPKFGHMIPTDAGEFARGQFFRMSAGDWDFGALQQSYRQTRELSALVVMTHTRRLDAAKKLAADFKAHGAELVVDPKSDIMANAAKVLETLNAAKGAPDSWVMVFEDDIEPAPGLALELPRVLQSLPAGVVGFSLHSDTRELGQGWRPRKRGEILRTQAIGWRLDFVPVLQAALDVWRTKLDLSKGWDTSCSRAIDAHKLKAVISCPSLVQHQTTHVQSVLGHYTRRSPSFRGGIPDKLLRDHPYPVQAEVTP